MFNDKKVLITGGAGFIGGHLVRRLLSTSNCYIQNIDNLCYSSDNKSISNLRESKNRYLLKKIDLKDSNLVNEVFKNFEPDFIFHLAAETHVDRSLDNPLAFMESNIIGTFNILQSSLEHYKKLNDSKKNSFKFLHISTDEVFGTLGNTGKFNESTKYDPRSPYSASKASSDHIVRAWHYSYKLPTLITNCSNNYGSYQFPEKLIPLSIFKAVRGENITIYGNGQNVRDWIYVEDHIDGLLRVASKGKPGNTYCIGGNNEISNNDLIQIICQELDNLLPRGKPYHSLIKYVKDRPGHDFRYSIDSSLMKNELNWVSKTDINEGIRKTVKWYIENLDWCKHILESSGYKGERLGIKKLH